MASKYVKLTIPDKLFTDGNNIAKEFGYSNIQDLTLESLRKQIIELKKQQALLYLKESHGSVQPKKRLTKKEKERIAKLHTPKRAKEITKEYGLEDIKI